MTPIITVDDLRAEGLDESTASDDALTAAIALAMEDLTQYTGGLWFSPIEFTPGAPLTVDGSGTETLRLPAPIVRLDAVYEDGLEMVLDDLAVYGRVDTLPDERKLPRLIKRTRTAGTVVSPWEMEASIVRSTAGKRIWPKVQRAVTLVGVFGFVEADGTSPPPLVRKVALRLALRQWRPLTDPLEGEARATGEVVRETTDGHTYELRGVRTSPGPTGNVEIDRILAMYRRRYWGGSTRSWQ